MKTRSCKEKAKRLQKPIAEKIGELIGLPVGKDCPVESREMGIAGCDIKLDSEAQKLFPFSVECKNAEKWDVHAAIRQCKKNTKPGTNWLVFFSKNNYPSPVVILDSHVFFDILKSKSYPYVAEKRVRTK